MIAPAGVILINELLPKDLRFKSNEVINSKIFKERMSKFAKKYPGMYATNISKIANLGEKMAFYMGSNVGPEDLKVNEKERKKLISQIESKLNKAKSIDAKRAILLNGLQKGTELSLKATSSKNEMVQQVKSGSRGKPVQFARMVVGPVYAVDMNQLPKPNIIKNSFSSGLTSNEYFNVASQGRYSSVQAANATSEPGALGKILIANADAQKITMVDCGTTNGITMDIDDHHILGRFEAGTNKLVDEAYVKQLKKMGRKKIKVRSPITCQAPKGVCAKCYGLLPTGKLPSVGDNVGIRSAQTIGEILTQMTLSTKHSAMGKNKENKLSGVEGFKAITNSPMSFSGSAVVTTSSGMVTRIVDAPQGGKYIYIGSKRYTTKPGMTVKVKQGQSVFAGQPLTDGIVTPKQVLETRGIGEARKHEANLLHSLFKDSTGKDLQKKHFELLSRAHLSLGQNKIGEINENSYFMSNYPKHKQKQPVGNMIIGKYMAEDVETIFKGTKIDNLVVSELKNKGYKSVYVTDEAPPSKPIFKSMEQKPNFVGNLFSKMNYRHISKAIKDEILYNKKPTYVNSYTSDRAEHTAGML